MTQACFCFRNLLQSSVCKKRKICLPSASSRRQAGASRKVSYCARYLLLNSCFQRWIYMYIYRSVLLLSEVKKRKKNIPWCVYIPLDIKIKLLSCSDIARAWRGYFKSECDSTANFWLKRSSQCRTPYKFAGAESSFSAALRRTQQRRAGFIGDLSNEARRNLSDGTWIFPLSIFETANCCHCGFSFRNCHPLIAEITYVLTLLPVFCRVFIAS